MASLLKVDKLDPQSGTALEIGTSGDTISVPSGATLDISASTLTPPATLPASSGVNLTSLNASALGSGTVPTARLGTGSASSSVFLAGDNTWIAAAGSGRILQTAMKQYGDSVRTSDTSYVYMTPMGRSFASLSSTSSKVLISLTGGTISDDSDIGSYRFYGQINDTGGFSSISNELARPHGTNNRYGNIAMQYLWEPSTTDKVEVQVWGKSIGGALVGINVADVNIMMLMYEIGG